ncbi:hypothetical protein C8F04DRAFT_1184859 [Mycena alexandri]|uniref:Uncharacterized protein n=1 Tax=Mycena alexandri TaxID=1745969 RepID=A0AAD6SRS0_9AGAR|nr:hypothetical protein C8F04DRAFT_1184859 [Mycena alexandri]
MAIVRTSRSTNDPPAYHFQRRVPVFFFSLHSTRRCTPTIGPLHPTLDVSFRLPRGASTSNQAVILGFGRTGTAGDTARIPATQSVARSIGAGPIRLYRSAETAHPLAYNTVAPWPSNSPAYRTQLLLTVPPRSDRASSIQRLRNLDPSAFLYRTGTQPPPQETDRRVSVAFRFDSDYSTGE